MKCLFCSFYCFPYFHSQLCKAIPRFFYMFCFIALAHLAPHSKLKVHCQGLLSWCVAEVVTHFVDCQESVPGPFIWHQHILANKGCLLFLKNMTLRYKVTLFCLAVPFFLEKNLPFFGVSSTFMSYSWCKELNKGVMLENTDFSLLQLEPYFTTFSFKLWIKINKL